MLSIRHSIGKTPLLEHMANDSKSVAHFRCYAIAPPPGVYAPDVRSFSCAPVAPVAIIRAYFHTERDVTCDVRLIVPFQDVGFPHNPVVLALTIWLEVLLHYPCGTFLVVLPFCPSQYLVP